MEIFIKCSSLNIIPRLFFFVFICCSSSLFFYGGIAATENKTDPIEVEALGAIFRNWKIDGEKTWNINSTNPCIDYVVNDSNDETIDDFSSSRGKLEILCSCDNTTSICNIIRLSAWDLKLSGTIPNELENLTKLVYMDLDDNSLTGELPDFLWTLTEMETMTLSGNDFDGSISPEIRNMKNIKKLELERNQFSGNIPNSFWNLTNLETFSIKSNNFNGSLPQDIENLKNLIDLDLYDNSFEGSIPLSIGNLINLENLDFEDNSFEGSIPSSIRYLVDLEELYLSNNNFEGEILNSLGNLTKLKILDLEDNSFQGSIPSSIRNLVDLEELRLSSNKFGGNIRLSFWNLTNLEGLWISNNNFSGFLPEEIGNLKNLNTLDLSINNFGGSLPNQIGNMAKLLELDLSKNNFSSRLPEEIGNLTKLEELDISENNFTGSIPNNLIQRQSLGLLNISFEGNPELCFDDLCGKSSSNKTTIIIIAVICSTIVVFSVIIFTTWKVKRNSRNTLSKEQLDGPLQGMVPGIHTSNKEFTYLDLVTMTGNFNKIIGKGGFGNVYYGIDQRNGSEVAVKVLSDSSIQGSKEFQMEAQILSRIHHKNFVSLVGYCTETGHLALVYEYMEGGSLRNLISGQCNSSTTISWRDRIRMGLEIAQGLNYLHQECQPAIVHRDVKTTNILLSRKFEVKIADFRLSKIFENGANTSMSTIVMGTFGYIDPEYHKTQKLNEKSDVYSCY